MNIKRTKLYNIVSCLENTFKAVGVVCALLVTAPEAIKYFSDKNEPHITSKPEQKAKIALLHKD
jgi:hypothetical protein